MDAESINYNEEDEYDTTEVIVESGVDEDINTVMNGYKTKLKSYKTNPSLTKYEKCKAAYNLNNPLIKTTTFS